MPRNTIEISDDDADNQIGYPIWKQSQAVILTNEFINIVETSNNAKP